MNRFWDNLFKKKFSNERERIKNMLILQQAVFAPCADLFTPKGIEMLEDEMMVNNESLMLDPDVYQVKNEEMMVHTIETERLSNWNEWRTKQLKLLCYVSSFKVLARSTKSTISTKVYHRLSGPITKLFKHTATSNPSQPLGHKPPAYRTEILKLVRFFLINGDANLLVDRKFCFDRVNIVTDPFDPANIPAGVVTNDAQMKIIVDACEIMSKFTIAFDGETEKQAQARLMNGKAYCLSGVMPMVYKYVTGFNNLTNYREEGEVLVASNRVVDLLDTMDGCKEFIATLIGLETKHLTFAEISADIEASVSTVAQGKDKFELGKELQNNCSELLKIIDLCYDSKANAGFYIAIEQYLPLTNNQFIWSKLGARFEDDTVLTAKEKQTQATIGCLLIHFKTIKNRWIHYDEESSLINFFKRNLDNLRGVFESTIEILFDVPENTTPDGGIAKNPVVGNFWCNTSCQYYIQFLVKLFTAGGFARKMFYNFVNETEDDVTIKSMPKHN
jgi:hypothetical protein